MFEIVFVEMIGVCVRIVNEQFCFSKVLNQLKNKSEHDELFLTDDKE